jgi:hypothetical protein
MNKQQTIELLQKQLPGFYSVEQVISIINDIDETGGKLSSEQIEQLTQSIQDRVARAVRNFDTSDIVDYSSAEFNIGYNNTLELDCVDVDLDSLEDEIEGTIESSVTEFFESLEEESDVVELEREENND